MEPLQQLPAEIQQGWRASLIRPEPTPKGAFRLVAIRPTKAKSFEEQRIVVLVLDENGFPMPNIEVMFAYDTSKDFYAITADFLWTPPKQLGHKVMTQGSGQIDQIQGSAVKEGQAGGITVFLWTPEYASDIVHGAGMLGDHTGLHLTFQRKPVGVVSLAERLSVLETWVTNFESRLEVLEKK